MSQCRSGQRALRIPSNFVVWGFAVVGSALLHVLLLGVFSGVVGALGTSHFLVWGVRLEEKQSVCAYFAPAKPAKSTIRSKSESRKKVAEKHDSTSSKLCAQAEKKKSVVNKEKPSPKKVCSSGDCGKPQKSYGQFCSKSGGSGGGYSKVQAMLEREIARLWSPPIGVMEGTECVVKFVVDAHGRVGEFDIVKPSGMVVYDLSIARVAAKFVFDKCLWGKCFTVDFCR